MVISQHLAIRSRLRKRMFPNQAVPKWTPIFGLHLLKALHLPSRESWTACTSVSIHKNGQPHWNMRCAAAYQVHPLRQRGSSQHTYGSCLGKPFTPPGLCSFLEEAAAVEFLHRRYAALLLSCIPESRLYTKFSHQKSFIVRGPPGLPSFVH